MIGARAKISGSGRRPKIQVHPASSVFNDEEDEIMALTQIYRMSHEQAVEHRKMAVFDMIYVTQYARIPCDYQVIVYRGARVPRQGEMGASVAQVTFRRIDGKHGPFNWDDMQEIKDVIFGKDAEGMELFPKRSRAIRGNNQLRYMWVFVGGDEIPVGWSGSK